jgi:hypothetical protein
VTTGVVRGVQENGSYVVAVKGANGEEVLHCCYTLVAMLLHCFYTVVTLLLQCCHSVGTLLVHCCYHVVTMLLHSGDGEDGAAQRHHSTYTVVTLR